MDPLLVLARVVLSLVFVVAAVAKLLDQKGTRHAAAELGVPNVLVATTAVLLPLVELAVAVALLPVGSASRGAMSALALLGVFATVIGANLLLGRRPPCRCFGSADARPIGWPTLMRNGVLLALAGFVFLAGPGPSIAETILRAARSDVATSPLVVVLVAAVVVQGWFTLHLMRQQGRLLLRFDALEAGGGSVPELFDPTKKARHLSVGEVAPSFQLPSLAGGSVGLDDLRGDGRTVLLVFLNPRCKPCMALAPGVEQWQQDHGATLRIAVLGSGWEQAARTRDLVSAVSDVLSDEGNRVSDDYGVSATPAVVLVDPNGVIASGVATGKEDIEKLVATAAAMGEREK